MTQTPGTQSYMPPEALRPNPRYDIEVDVFSLGVMMVHVLSGQWPFPSEATRVDPRNPARVIGLSEVERRTQYLNIIGRPSDEGESHPLLPLIERCLNNSPNLRPNASELVERMSDASSRQPLTFSNRMDMMQRIDSIQTERETLQTRVSVLEGQVERGEVAQREQRERSERQETALTMEVGQLRLQVDSLEAEKNHISTTATTREELLHTKMQRKDRSLQNKKRQLQKKEELYQASLESREKQHQVEIQRKEELHQESLEVKEKQHQIELRELQEGLQRQHEVELREQEELLKSKEKQHQVELSQQEERLEVMERQLQAKVKRRDEQLQAKATELSSQSSLLSQQRSTIESLHTQLRQARQHLASGTQVRHILSYVMLPSSQ